jgi:hypothetical protein
MDAINSLSFISLPPEGTPSLTCTPAFSKKMLNLFDSTQKIRHETPKVESSKLQFVNWRQSDIPDLSYKPIGVIPPDRLEMYQKANLALEKAIGDTALRYVHKNGEISSKEKGPILEFANEMCQRYLSLYRTYVRWEISQGIPMISAGAGPFKNFGLQTSQIIEMHNEFTLIKKNLLEKFSRKDNPLELSDEGAAAFNKILQLLIDPKARQDFAIQAKEDRIKEFMNLQIEHFEKSSSKKAIDEACLVMRDIYGIPEVQVEALFAEIVHMQVYPHANPDERLLMEIRHRVGGEGSIHFPGSLGQNPLAYLNLIRKGEPGNLAGEFRGLMYFIFMSKDFANEAMGMSGFIDFANEMLKKEDCGWQIDQNFVDAMLARKPSYAPAIYRYGTYASINRAVRRMATQQERDAYCQKFPNPTFEELIKQKAHLDANFKYQLTQREILNLTGEYSLDKIDIRNRLKLISGASLFHIYKLEEIPELGAKSVWGKKHLQMVDNLKIPLLAGISGTLDLSTTMAGLVGIGIGERQPKDMEIIKLAYLAFMIPTSDHSAHEILLSAKTFGQEYVPGPGFEKYIYPSQGKQFLQFLEEAQKKRGFELPSHYLT